MRNHALALATVVTLGGLLPAEALAKTPLIGRIGARLFPARISKQNGKLTLTTHYVQDKNRELKYKITQHETSRHEEHWAKLELGGVTHDAVLYRTHHQDGTLQERVKVTGFTPGQKRALQEEGWRQAAEINSEGTLEIQLPDRQARYKRLNPLRAVWKAKDESILISTPVWTAIGAVVGVFGGLPGEGALLGAAMGLGQGIINNGFNSLYRDMGKAPMASAEPAPRGRSLEYFSVQHLLRRISSGL